MRRYNTAVACQRECATRTRYFIQSRTSSLIDLKPVGNNLENVGLFTIKIGVFIMALVKCLRMRIKVLFIASAVYLSPDITRDNIIFSVKQLSLHLVVLLKIMVSPVLYQTIDTRRLLKTIPLFSNSCTVLTITFR